MSASAYPTVLLCYAAVRALITLRCPRDQLWSVLTPNEGCAVPGSNGPAFQRKHWRAVLAGAVVKGEPGQPTCTSRRGHQKWRRCLKTRGLRCTRSRLASRRHRGCLPQAPPGCHAYSWVATHAWSQRWPGSRALRCVHRRRVPPPTQTLALSRRPLERRPAAEHLRPPAAPAIARAGLVCGACRTRRGSRRSLTAQPPAGLVTCMGRRTGAPKTAHGHPGAAAVPAQAVSPCVVC